MDDIKSSHRDPVVSDDFHKWLTQTYGQDGIGDVKVTRGKRHDYLAIILDYSEPEVLMIDMCKYIQGMITDFPEKIGLSKCPWTEKLF